MKITFDISQLVPKYLMADRNGRAVARAIERAFQYVAKAAEDGLDIIQDVEKMPEWRLDEVAREYNIPYDFTAAIEKKREWIRNATVMYRVLGTREAVSQYLRGYFGEVEIEENWEYGGLPYHFRVWLGGVYTQEMDDWSRKSIEMAKNTRSVLDVIWVKNNIRSTVHLGSAIAGHDKYKLRNDVEHERDAFIGSRMAVAGITEVLAVDEANSGRNIEREIRTAGYIGGIVAGHAEVTLENVEVN